MWATLFSFSKSNVYKICVKDDIEFTGQLWHICQYNINFLIIIGEKMKRSRFLSLLLFFLSLITSIAMTITSAEADAILITMKGDKGTGHTSIISQDKKGRWHYFFWGDKIAFDDIVPKKAMKNINAFNAWLWKIRKNNPKRQKIPSYYTRATYILGDFSRSTEYYQEQVRNHSMFKYYWIFNYCSVVSSKALSFGVLRNGTKFQDLINSHRTILDWIPFYDYYPVNLHNLVDRSIKGTENEGRSNWGVITNPKILKNASNGGNYSSFS